MAVRTVELKQRNSAREKLIRKNLGSLEAEVMQALWKKPGSSVRDVTEALDGRKRAYTTVMTVMNRLYEKGLLSRSPAGRAYLYQPAMTEDEFLRWVSGQHVRSLMEDFGELAVAQFIGEVRQLPPEDIERIRSMLEADE
ncbi:MAG TPA: BlaI/MecI/CopY family transcriptional regulator [Dehalococcoidia bacterium]|nr:BlaI/MecI/CopY family transcriptional regulator [Dehalococcoidia bacterium]